MRRPVLSAWIAAGLAWSTVGAHAQQADCDIVCRLQGYLSTDHMAAAPEPQAAVSGPAGKRRGHAATVGPKTPKTHASTPPAVAGGVMPAVKAAAAPAVKPPSRPIARIEPARTVKPAAPGPTTAAKRVSPVAAAEPIAPVRAHAPRPAKTLATAGVTPQPAPVEPAPVRPKRLAHVAPHATPGPRPVASATLIPGSARLVPAELQVFDGL